jgi:hypothetical protein
MAVLLVVQVVQAERLLVLELQAKVMLAVLVEHLRMTVIANHILEVVAQVLLVVMLLEAEPRQPLVVMVV